MLDTGCRRAVAGPTWHREMQASLIARGFKYGVDFYFEEITERYAFGAGKVFLSKKRWVYPCNPHGQSTTLRIAEIEPDVPGLAGPDEMEIMKVQLDFKSSPPTATLDNVQDTLRYSESRHLVVDLLPVAVSHMKIVEITVKVKNMTPF